MITVYGIRNCDTVKRARQRLDAAGIGYRFHDFKVDGLDETRARGWIDVLGADAVLNRRGTSWRQLDAVGQARASTDLAGLLAANPSLVKRPLFERDGALRIGFAVADEAAILAWLQAG